MKWMEAICGFKQDSKTHSENAGDNTTEINLAENSEEKSQDIDDQPIPRDGMSAESAKYLIGQCPSNKGYKVYGLENKGRYFTAMVLDQKGNMVKELLVDKLNGNVRFIR